MLQRPVRMKKLKGGDYPSTTVRWGAYRLLMCLLFTPSVWLSCPAAVASPPSAAHIEAIRLFHEQQYEEALPEFLILLDSMVTDNLLEKTAKCYASLDRSADGNSLLRSWVGDAPFPPPLSYAASFLCDGSDQALDLLESSVRGAPENLVYIKSYTDNCRSLDSLERTERFFATLGESPGKLFASGYLARLHGDYPQSAKLLEEAYREGADTLLTLGSLAAAHWYLGRLDLAVEWYEIACAYLDRHDNWEGEVPYFGSMATALMRLERYEEALPLFRRAIRRSAATGQHSRELSYLLSAGDTALLIGNNSLADSLLQRAAALSRDVGNPQLELAALKSRAQSLIIRGEPELAIATMEEPVARAVADGVPGADEAAVVLGEACAAASLPLRAESLFTRALSMAEETGSWTLQGRALSGLGHIALDRGDLSGAERLFRRAIDLSVKGDDRPGERRRKSYLALTFEHGARYQEALDLYLEVLPLDRAAGDRGAVAARLSNIASVHEYLGEYREALRFREEALDSTRLLDRPGEVTKELANIGLIYMKVKSFGRAETALMEAVAAARESGDASTESHLLVYLGQLHIERSQAADALPLLDEAIRKAKTAGNLYSASDAHMLRGRAFAALGEPDKAESAYREALASARETGSLYTEWIVEFRRGEAARQRGADEEALEHFDRSIDLASSTRGELVEDRHRISFQEEKTRVFDAAIQLLIDNGRTDDAFLYAERGKARALIDLVAESSPAPRSLGGTAATTTVREVLDRVRAGGEIFAAFWLGEGRSQLWIFSEEGMEHHQLPGKEIIEERVAFLNDRLRRRGEWAGGAASLGNMLLAPLSGRLDRSSRLLIAPDGALHLLPFEIVSVGRFPLLDATSLRYVPSATVLRSMEERAGASRWDFELVAFGNPDLPAGIKLDPLPHAAREVEEIGRLFAEGEAIVLTGSEATEIRANDYLHRARYLHFATHTVIDDNSPLQSSILLAPDREGLADGRFQAAEAAGRRIPARLVVLSGCETGLGRRAQGEGVLGFARIFLGAGAEGLVVSLWRVNDASTAMLISRFYEIMLGGAAPAEALQIARRELATGHAGQFSHPWYWAPFVLIGY